MKVRDKLVTEVGLVVDAVAGKMVETLKHILPQHDQEVRHHDILRGPGGLGYR